MELCTYCKQVYSSALWGVMGLIPLILIGKCLLNNTNMTAFGNIYIASCLLNGTACLMMPMVTIYNYYTILSTSEVCVRIR